VSTSYDKVVMGHFFEDRLDQLRLPFPQPSSSQGKPPHLKLGSSSLFSARKHFYSL